MAGEIQTGFTEQSIGAQIKYMGFKEAAANVWRNEHEGVTYGVDFGKQEIFKMDGFERVHEDAGDDYLAKIHSLVQLSTVSTDAPHVVEAEIVEEAEVEHVDARPARKEIPEEKHEDFVQAGLVEAKPQCRTVAMPVNHEPKLTIDEIKKYICPEATDQEAYTFMKLCDARRLNPFTKEAYLVKYKGQKTAATIIVGKDAFTKKASQHVQFDGFEAGIIVLKESGDIDRREGTFTLKDEEIVGGWAKVHRKDCSHPFMNEVAFDEYVAMKRNKMTGKMEPNSMWTSKPGTMIRKVALVQSLREAFTEDLGGCYDSAEMGGEA